MKVYWLEQTESDVPANADWLSASEAECLNALRVPKRRADWRLGRWTAKRALALYLGTGDSQSLSDIEIRPAASGAPEVFVANRPAAARISLSHSNGTALCAIASFGAALGCDLELIEPRSDAFIADYFTTEEQDLVAQASAADRPRLSTLLWSAKESTLKALREGLRQDTRAVAVSLNGAPRSDGVDGERDSVWQPLHVCYTDGQRFHGWWQQNGNLLRTLVTAPRAITPIALG